MRKRMCKPIQPFLLLPVLLAGISAMGQNTPISDRTGTYLNGRFWEALNMDQKRAFVLGLTEGIRTGASELNLDQNKSEEEYQKAVHTYVHQYYANEFTYEDHIKELDKVYADTENILIPIPLALQYCALKLGGTRTKAELEICLIGFRKIASVLEETKR
jgi:hypothetical protein